MLAIIIDETDRTKKICSVFIPEIVNLCDEAEVNLVINQKQIAFCVLCHDGDNHLLKKIDKVSDYYCPDRKYDAFICYIDDWEKLYSLVK